MASPAFRLVGVDVDRGGLPVVHAVSLTVAPGEMVGLIGPNGAGKTTLLQGCLGRWPTRGIVEVAGHLVVGLPLADRLRAGLVLCPEGRRLFADMTVGDNLRLGGWQRPKAEVAREVARWCARLPWLAERLETRAGTLSGGEAQVVAIIRALMAAPRVLLLDEPVVGLSPVAVEQMAGWLEDVRAANGMSVVIAEQTPVLSLRLASRVAWFRHGQVVGASSRKALASLDAGALADVYFGAGRDDAGP